MSNTKGKLFKNAHLICAIDSLIAKSGLRVYWKKVKGHSVQIGPDKEGNDEADRLAREGMVSGQIDNDER